jgi:hypothetical protein
MIEALVLVIFILVMITISLANVRREKKGLEDAIAWAEEKVPFIDRLKPKDYIASHFTGWPFHPTHRSSYRESRNWELLMYAAMLKGSYHVPDNRKKLNK